MEGYQKARKLGKIVGPVSVPFNVWALRLHRLRVEDAIGDNDSYGLYWRTSETHNPSHLHHQS